MEVKHTKVALLKLIGMFHISFQLFSIGKISTISSNFSLPYIMNKMRTENSASFDIEILAVWSKFHFTFSYSLKNKVRRDETSRRKKFLPRSPV